MKTVGQNHFLGTLPKVPSIRHGKLGETQNSYNSLDEQKVVGFKAVIRILCINVTERIYLNILNVSLHSFCWFRERLPNWGACVFSSAFNTFIILMTQCRLLLPVCLAGTTQRPCCWNPTFICYAKLFNRKKPQHIYSEENEEHFLEEFTQIRLAYYVPRKEGRLTLA